MQCLSEALAPCSRLVAESILTAPIIAFYVPLLVGSGIVAIALRGKAILAPPRCARCGHLLPITDPRALPHVASAACEALVTDVRPRSPRPCAECGSDLHARRGTRWFRTRRRWVLLAFGVMVVGLAKPCEVSLTPNDDTANLGAARCGAAHTSAPPLRGERVLALLPDAELLSLGLGSDDIAGSAISALHAKHCFRAYGIANLDRIVATAQDHADFPWPESAAEALMRLAQDAMVMGVCTRVEFISLARRLARSPRIMHDTILRSGEELVLDQWEGGFGSGLAVFRVREVRWHDRTLMLLPATRPGCTREEWLPMRVLLPLPPGDQVIDVVFERRLRAGRPRSQVPLFDTPDAVDAVVERFPVTIVASDAPSWVLTAQDPRLREEVQERMKPARVSVDWDSEKGACIWWVDWGDDAPAPSTRCAFRMDAECDGTSVLIGEVVVLPRSSQTSFERFLTTCCDSACLPHPPDSVTLTFTAKPEILEPLAELSDLPPVDPVTIFGGTLTYPNVPLVSNRRGPLAR